MYQKYYIKIITILITLLFGFSFVEASVWVPPKQPATNTNTDKPIDTSFSNQIKFGSLDLPTLTSSFVNSDVFCLNNDNRDLTSGRLSLGCVDSWDFGAGGTLNGSGIVNYLAKWTDATNLIETFIFDNGTNVGINTTNPDYDFDIEGDLNSTRVCINGDCRSNWPQPSGECMYSGKAYSNGSLCAVFTKRYTTLNSPPAGYTSSAVPDYVDYVITCINGNWSNATPWKESSGLQPVSTPRCNYN